MSLHVFWPASACLALFVVGVIMVLLKYGSRFCKLRHEPLPSDQEWEGKTYTHVPKIMVKANKELIPHAKSKLKMQIENFLLIYAMLCPMLTIIRNIA